MLDEGFGWTGTAKDLLDKINSKATEQQKRDKRWPRTPHGMSGRLRRASEILRARGWAVEFDRTPGGKRTRTITIAAVSHGDGPQSSQTSHRPESSKSNGLGRDDKGDDAAAPASHRPIVPQSSRAIPLIPLNSGQWDVRDDAARYAEEGRDD